LEASEDPHKNEPVVILSLHFDQGTKNLTPEKLAKICFFTWGHVSHENTCSKSTLRSAVVRAGANARVLLGLKRLALWR
jgi:hypothetical protein